jgi:hypothetical protein
LSIPYDCTAQAWLPLEGEGTIAFSFQHVDADGHFLEGGDKLPGYRTRADNLVFEMGYGITDRLAVNLLVPFVNVKYRGPEEPFNLPENTLDDGRYHGAISDLRFELRYNLLEEPLVLTPFSGAVIPSHSYETLGESAPGRGFQEFPIGVYAGRLLDPVLPRMFVHGSYAYNFVRQDVGIPLNYSNYSFEVGYFVTSSISVSFLYRGLTNHDGLSFNELFVAPPEIFVNLDRVVRAKFNHVGVSVSFPVGDTLSMHANYLDFASGVDAHYGGALSLGFSWTFQTKEQPILFPTGS